MAGHEVDGFGGDEVSGEDEVTLVFAIFFVHQNDHAAIAKLIDDFMNGS